MTTREHHDADPVVEVTPDDPEISDDPDELREQISHTRTELGETVEALAAKADVKAQVKEKVTSAREQVAETVSEVDADQARRALASVPVRVRRRPLPAVLAAAGVVLVWVTRRRRTRRG
jgi:hypothetical protein